MGQTTCSLLNLDRQCAVRAVLIETKDAFKTSTRGQLLRLQGI